LALGKDFQFAEEILTNPLNPTLYAWDVLVRDMHYPFIKTELLRSNRLGLKNLSTWSDLALEAPPAIITAASLYEDSHRWLIPERRSVSLPLQQAWGPFRRQASLLYARMNHRYDQARRLARDITSGDTGEIARKIRKSKRLGWLFNGIARQKLQTPNPDSARMAYFTEARQSLNDFLESSRLLELPAHTSSHVTIILVLYNKAELTYRCLESLSTLTDKARFHVLIIDNASSDDTNLLLQRIRGATIVRNESNVGFLRACNQAADLVTAPYILFLNNDTILYANAIDSALENLQNTKVGAVGGRIVLPSNELQEAGSIFWNDGTCVGYGRGLSLEADECMHRRIVDYCSGVFLMTPTKLFRELGGFDLRFAPAYYEEADYCAQLQSRGLSVVYDPRILVRHVEFGSSERSSAAFALMNTNREKFLEKNRSLLGTKHPPHSPQHKARSVATGRRRWLFLDDRVALSHLGAGYPRMNSIIHHLADTTSYDITIACTESFAGDWENIRRNIPIDIEVLDLTAAYRRELFLRERLEQFDVVWVSRPSNMRHLLASSALKSLSERSFVLVYDAEAIFADRSLSEAKVFGLPTDQAQSDLEVELHNGAHADIVIAVCESDAVRWRTATTRSVEIIGLDAPISPGPKNFSDRKDILFAGSLHDILSPNGDSLCWFMGQVMPLINEALPDVRVKAVGYTHESVKHQFGRRSKNFSLIGQVPELRPYIIEHRIMIAPTRFAAGVPQKVFDAAVCGTPTVCSPLIASQMTWRDGSETLVGSIDDPKHFADQCIRLYTDPELWGNVYEQSLASMRAYSSRYELRGSLDKVLSAIDSLVALGTDKGSQLNSINSNQNAA
jgi:GT2 family glycosyltransferase/glycosyltransferase involved in cell wall biosynthesis